MRTWATTRAMERAAVGRNMMVCEQKMAYVAMKTPRVLKYGDCKVEARNDDHDGDVTVR